MLTSSTVAANEMALLTETATTNERGEVIEVRMQRTYTYAGACAPQPGAHEVPSCGVTANPELP